MLRTKPSAPLESKHRELQYTNADLSNVQEQIRQQVAYQKLIQAQSQIKLKGMTGKKAIGKDKNADAIAENVVAEQGVRSSKNILWRGNDPTSISSKELSWGSRNVPRIGSHERPDGARPVRYNERSSEAMRL